MPIPSHWPPDVQRRAREFLALFKYYWFSRTVSEVAAPHLVSYVENTQRDSLDTFRGIGLISYWIASIEVLTEGWTELQLSDARIDELLASPHRSVLRRYRHTVFHFQHDLDEPRIGALSASEEVMDWVMALGEAYQQFFDPHAEGIQVARIRPWLFGPTSGVV